MLMPPDQLLQCGAVAVLACSDQLGVLGIAVETSANGLNPDVSCGCGNGIFQLWS